MEFGRVKDIRGVDLGLPPDDPATLRVLQAGRGSGGPPGRAGADAGGRGPGSRPEILMGLPLWNSDEMARLVCPPGTPKNRRLQGYARQFNAIELNSSGYGLAPANAKAWAAETPPGFRFCPKVPREVSHAEDLTRVSERYEAFCLAAAGFGDRLGTALLQFPESFDPRRFRELEVFLRVNAFLLPLAVEVRNPGWFLQPGPREAYFGLLESLGLTAVITDAPGRRDAAHMRLTGRQAFIRFCGHDRGERDLQRVEAWVDRLEAWADRGLERVHLFLHHIPDHVSAEWAVDFAAALRRRGWDVAAPRLHPEDPEAVPQLDLFAT
jgi:uncharacterized protein YecE (DUF72 family)